ncbi:MAG: response regulator, partial [Spirochaetia bacterium]|nr:response regulator [Spirochaetia bacterium]
YVILMDLQMPVMNGFDAARAIRSRGSRTPIYAVTAAALSEVKTQSLEAGMDGCITKPFKPAQLYAAVQKYAPTDNAG